MRWVDDVNFDRASVDYILYKMRLDCHGAWSPMSLCRAWNYQMLCLKKTICKAPRKSAHELHENWIFGSTAERLCAPASCPSRRTFGLSCRNEINQDENIDWLRTTKKPWTCVMSWTGECPRFEPWAGKGNAESFSWKPDWSIKIFNSARPPQAVISLSTNSRRSGSKMNLQNTWKPHCSHKNNTLL